MEVGTARTESLSVLNGTVGLGIAQLVTCAQQYDTVAVGVGIIKSNLFAYHFAN
ncbi:hypothetical protein [Segatella albensis]|jgi:hypothetical protein|uniref:hypothetical protein n=1 Tax=Segatella albensis TaxID=77768 RepID=UPI0012B662DA|nr:hypothetical protein [Segatella albensis]